MGHEEQFRPQRLRVSCRHVEIGDTGAEHGADRRSRLDRTGPRPTAVMGSSRLAARGNGIYISSAFDVQEFEAMPETTFTFRVDQELKTAFTAAAHANDRPGSQLLRDFMRDCVGRAEHDVWFRAEVE